MTNNSDNKRNIEITKTDKNNIIGVYLMFALMTLYVIILFYYTIKSNLGSSGEQNDEEPSLGIKDIWNQFGEITGKKISIYLIILITLIYTLYTIILIGTTHNTKNLASSRFWEESLIIAFTFSFGLSIPGYHLNKEPHFGFTLFIFIFSIIFNIAWEMTGFYNYLYPYDPESINCEIIDNKINLTDCYESYIDQPPPVSQKIYAYLFIFLLISFLLLSIIPSIFSPYKAAEVFRPGEPFYFIDTFYLGLVNGIMVLLGIQYTNVRRGDELLPSYESSIIILKFVIFHLASRFAGFL